MREIGRFARSSGTSPRTHYLVGDSFSVADISLYAYVHVAHEAGFDLDEFPNLSMWLRRISREPGVLPMHVNPEATEDRARGPRD
ncbi:MAG TPA: glutathione binding-like protein [Polyangiaceae bacterium]|nr:glutathione binding-like protein [Polyangiaceae bacterium]